MFPQLEPDYAAMDRADCREYKRRMEAAEAERDQLRGEVAVLREALQQIQNRYKIVDEATASQYVAAYHADESNIEEIARRALTATPRAAQLGALIEAALKRRTARLAVGDVRHPETHPREYVEVLHAMVDAEKAEDAAAAAVLTATPTPTATVSETAAEEEGTGQ